MSSSRPAYLFQLLPSVQLAQYHLPQNSTAGVMISMGILRRDGDSFSIISDGCLKISSYEKPLLGKGVFCIGDSGNFKDNI